MGIVSLVAKVVGALVLVVVGLGAFLYFTDYEAQATVTQTGKDGSGHYAIIVPRLAPFYEHRAALDSQSAQFVCEGYQVTFRLQSQAFRVFDETGRVLVYDSEDGLQAQDATLRCRLGI